MAATANVVLTDRAARRIEEIVAGEPANTMLRISVEGGGCSEYLAGSEIDFVDDLIGASFKIQNPNATASCGCGTSFSL